MLRELPEGWVWRRLGDVATVSSGNSAPQGDEFFIDGKFPFVRTFDVGKEKANNNLVNVRDYINEHAIEKNGMHLFPEKTLLIPKSGASTFLNHRALLGIPAYVSSHLATVNANDNLLPEYLFYWSQLLDARFITHDVNYPSLRLSEIESAQIPLPPIPVQRQIVTVLEQAEAVKRQRQEADALMGALLQSIFYEMFGDPVRNERGWKVMALEELSSHIIDCPHSTPEYEEDTTPYPCIRTTELKDGYIDWTQMKYLNEKNYLERINRLTPNEGDIIFGREGSFGVAVRVPKNVSMCLGQRVMLFRPNPKYCNSEFFWALLNSDAILRQANSKTSGSTVAHINVTDIKKFGGICPPLALQQQFARFVECVERIRDQQVASGKEIEGLCEGLMARAFVGELVS